MLTEVRGLISTVEQVRRRILADKFLRGWIRWCLWVLVGLVLLTAFSPVLAAPVAGAGALIVTGAAISLLWARRSQPSAYEAACRLDAVAGLQDRLSTALHLATLENPDEMVLRQRQDALARLAQAEPRRLFPVRVPSAGRILALALAVAALFAYRMYFGPPMPALLHRTAHSRLVEAILSPIVHAMEKDPQKAQAAGNQAQGEGKDGEKQALEAQDGTPGQADDGSRVADGREQEEQGQQDEQAADASDKQAGDPGQQGQSQSEQSGNQSGESQQAQEQGQQETKQPGDSQQKQQAGNSGQPSGGKGSSSQDQAKDQQQSGSGSDRPSLAQSVMQALKNLLSNARGQSGQQQQQTAQNGQPSSSQGSQQGGNAGDQNSAQSPSDQEGKESQSSSSNKSPQDGNQKSSTGIGTEPGSQEMRPNPPLASKTSPDRVPLESTDFSGQARVRTTVGPGTAQVPLTDQSADLTATTNGAEQENIPQRYRLYVQKYFDHAGGGKDAAVKAQP